MDKKWERYTPSQEQPELGGVDWLPYKATPEPHKLSPEQFEAHPYAVFHSTSVDPRAKSAPKDLFHHGPFDESNWQRHYGTLQASVDRMVDQGRFNNRIYSYWHEPDDEGNTDWYNGKRIPHVVEDRDANPEKHFEPSEAWKAAPTSMYYENSVEDPGSISVVSKKPSAVRSHEDYVGQAIAEGKEHEVHPRTLALYKAGKLSAGETIHDVLPNYAKDDLAYNQRFIEYHRDALPGLQQVDFADHMNATHKFRGETQFVPHTEVARNLGPQWTKLSDQLTTDAQAFVKGHR